jgi:hypothetical protein
MNTPKFCVGEEVAVESEISPEYNTNRTEVVLAQYQTVEQNQFGVSQWVYQTAHQPDKTKIWMESSLRKINPDDSVSFRELMNKLNLEFAQ